MNLEQDSSVTITVFLYLIIIIYEFQSRSYQSYSGRAAIAGTLTVPHLLFNNGIRE